MNKNLKGWLWALAAASLIGIIVYIPFNGLGYGYSEGVRAGVITKFSNKGLIFKSWEGELFLGGMKKGYDGPVTNNWQFSVQDEAIIKKIQSAQVSGDRVQLHYIQWILNPIQVDTQYNIVEVE